MGCGLLFKACREILWLVLLIAISKHFLAVMGVKPYKNGVLRPARVATVF